MLVAIIALMALGSVGMWIGVPLGLIYLASQIAGSSRPSAGPYLLVLIGLPVGMALVGKGLGYLDRVHGRLTGRREDRRRATWLRSMRAERVNYEREKQEVTAIERILVITVALVVVLFEIWFFFFSPSPIGPGPHKD